MAANKYLTIIDIHLHLQKANNLTERAVQLIPQLRSYSHQNLDKQDFLTVATGVASNAAAIALQLSRGPATALGLLECVISGGLQDLRTDLSTLEQKHPQLAARFLEFREQLDVPLLKLYRSSTTALLTIEEKKTGVARLIMRWKTFKEFTPLLDLRDFFWIHLRTR